MDFKVGDKVFCLMFGEGIVTELIRGVEYCIEVDFGNVVEYYDSLGRYVEDAKYPTLFKERPSWFPKETKTVRKYKVVFRSKGKIHLSYGYYLDIDDFLNTEGNDDYEYLAILDDDIDYLEDEVEV